MKLFNNFKRHHKLSFAIVIIVLTTLELVSCVSKNQLLENTLKSHIKGKNLIGLSYQSSALFNKSKLTTIDPKPGDYYGDCLRDQSGPPQCNEERLRCADINRTVRCYIKAWHRCDKSDDFDTTCADLNFVCINYKIKDSKGKEIGLCAPKGTYMDDCTATKPCSKGYVCTEMSIVNRKENKCLVEKGQSCLTMKLCGQGLVCDGGTKACIDCQEGKALMYRSFNGFIKSLTQPPTCDQIKIGIE